MLLQETRDTRTPTATPLAGLFPRTQNLYQRLLATPEDQATRNAARVFLEQHLATAARMPCDLPATSELAQQGVLEEWMATRTLEVGEQYATYLNDRKAGKPRRFFTGKAHALHFLQAVAPTKLVDGAWLYGTLDYWQDTRFHPLIRTYLEELGDGVAEMNHVLLYRQLLARHGCEAQIPLADEYYLQGTLQLALAVEAEHFLPELIGYNLGYEQLPLHLLISAFELHELDIDPYYFTLHVTIDNAHSGHAHQAVQSVLQNLPVTGDRDVFLQRLRNGYLLNELGLGSTAIIRHFNLRDEVIAMLENKRTFGQHVHSDFCKLEGRTVNQWLSEPDQIPQFLSALETRGWIKPGQDPGESRFYQLIAGPNALMFGVFTPYEQRLLYEWIAGDWLAHSEPEHTQQRQNTFKPARGSRTRAANEAGPCTADLSQQEHGDLSPALEALRRELQALPRAEKMQRLIPLMSPSLHGTPEGLLATRLFTASLH